MNRPLNMPAPEFQAGRAVPPVVVVERPSADEDARWALALDLLLEAGTVDEKDNGED